jgi:hypothetical protein
LPPADYGGFDLSPDGRSLLTKSFTASGATEIRIFDLARRSGTLLDVGTGDISQPGWTADGRSILVSVAPRGVNSARVLLVPIDGRSSADTIMEGGLDRLAVSRDGRVVILQVSKTRSPNRYLTIGGDSKLFASHDGGAFQEPDVDPRRRSLAFAGRQVGDVREVRSWAGEIYLDRFPLAGHPMRVPSDGGYEALFSTKGDRIFIVSGSVSSKFH